MDDFTLVVRLHPAHVRDNARLFALVPREKLTMHGDGFAWKPGGQAQATHCPGRAVVEEQVAMRGQSAVEEYVISSTDGVQLWTIADGNGPLTILLSNGGPGCPDYLAPLAALLSGTGHRVVRWEQRGVGRSGGDPDGPFIIVQCIADMESIREHYGCRHWVVAGHSWGADLSLIYALAHPNRCAGLLCLAGVRLNNDREWYAEYARGVAEGREVTLKTVPPTNMAVNRQLSADFKRFVQLPSLFHDLAALQAPALFLYGAEDIRPSWAVAQVAALMPHAQFTLIPDADHYLYLTHPEQVNSQAGVYLSSLHQEGCIRGTPTRTPDRSATTSG